MPSAATQILQNLLSTLRTADLFAHVAIGKTSSETSVPRANIIYEGDDVFESDDTASTRWARLRASVEIHTRCDDSAESATRLADLAAATRETLIADPYRGQLCIDLPIGRATEVTAYRTLGNLKRPEAECTLNLRCHFELEEEE